MSKTIAVMMMGMVPALAGQALAYQDGAVRLAGYLARPAASQGTAPGVVVVHQWMGLSEHETQTADALAKLGYIALAADIYGEGVRPASAKADYTFIAYAGAVHAFTQKAAGNDPSKGAAYQEAAARRSWQHMLDFFHEIF